jgi:hypothetical protein
MEVPSAVALVNALIYKPNWTIRAEDNTARFEGTICVFIDYPARSLNRDQAASGYPEEIMTKAAFRLTVSDCNDDTTLYRKVIDSILRIETHEAREALRVFPTYWAPFHPHREGGMMRWGDPSGDLTFGIV